MELRLWGLSPLFSPFTSISQLQQLWVSIWYLGDGYFPVAISQSLHVPLAPGSFGPR